MSTEAITVQGETVVLLDGRHETDVEELSEHIRQRFSGSLLSLRQLEPFISEILRRFKILPRTKGVNGQYPTIAGCRTFKVWCETVLHRKDRTVRYMLAGGNKARSTTRKETVSATNDAAGILKYLDNHVSELDKTQQKLLALGLLQVISRLDSSRQPSLLRVQ